MGWKKALFFGGAVLVLAACSDSATAPSALRQMSAPATAAWGLPTSTTTTSGTTLVPTPLPVIDPICNGFVIRTGEETELTSTTTCISTDW